MGNPSQKVALVTGANKGLGFETARQIAKAGCTVLLGARNAALGEGAAEKLRAEGLDVRFVLIDISDYASITAAAETIVKQFDHLDILVNNAGIIVPGDGPVATTPVEALEMTYRTNVFGSIAVTQALLPLLQKAPSARIVNVSSGLGSLTQSGDPNYFAVNNKYLAYASSKAALNMFTVQLAWELRDTAIKVNSSDPGYTATDLNGNSGTQTVPEGSAETIRLALLPDDGPTGTYSDSKGIVPW